MASTPALDPQGTRGDSKGLLLAEQLLELAERAQSYTAASGATIALVRDGEMLIRTSNGTAPEVGAKVAMDEGICGICASTGKPQICTDADSGSMQVEGPYKAAKIRSMVAIPVHCNKQVKAVLTVLSQLPNSFSRTHVAILMTLRDVIGAKLEENPEVLGSDPAAPAVRLSSPPAEAAPAPAASAKTVEMKPQIPKMDPVRVTAPFPQAPAATPPAAAAAAAASAPTAKFSTMPAPAAKTAVPVAKAAAGPVMAAKPAATPVAKATAAAPVAQPAMKAAAAPAPAITLSKVDPDLLVSAEEPGSFVKSKARATAASEAPTASLSAYAAKPDSGQGMKIGAIAGIAAVVVIGVALGLHFYHDHEAAVQAAQTHAPAVQAPPPAPVSAEPTRLPEPQPAARTETSSKNEVSRASQPEVTVKNFKTENGNATGSKPASAKSDAESKPSREEAAATSQPVLKLAPPAKPQVEAEAPTLALATSSGFPNLPTPTAKISAPVSTIVSASLVRKVDPVYPQAARSMGQEAIVRLTATISPSGDVTNVKPVSGPIMFQMTAVEAVKQWRYKPATLNGKPVESTADIVLRFAARR